MNTKGKIKILVISTVFTLAIVIAIDLACSAIDFLHSFDNIRIVNYGAVAIAILCIIVGFIGHLVFIKVAKLI